MNKYQFPKERMHEIYESLDQTGGMLVKETEFRFWIDKIVNEELGKNDIVSIRGEVIAAINQAKLSILRGMHSGDKVAGILVNLVEVINNNKSQLVTFPFEEILRSKAWEEAEAYALRITTVKESKEEKL